MGREERDSARVRAFGLRLRELRQERGLSQEQLAERAEIHRAVIGFVERAEREVGIALAWRLADGLGVAPGELFPPEAAPA